MIEECHRLLNAAGVPGNHQTGEGLSGRVKQLIEQRDEWKQAAGVEAGLRREFLAESERLRMALEQIIPLDIHHKTYQDGSESTGCGPIALIAKRALGRGGAALTDIKSRKEIEP